MTAAASAISTAWQLVAQDAETPAAAVRRSSNPQASPARRADERRASGEAERGHRVERHVDDDVRSVQAIDETAKGGGVIGGVGPPRRSRGHSSGCADRRAAIVRVRAGGAEEQQTGERQAVRVIEPPMTHGRTPA